MNAVRSLFSKLRSESGQVSGAAVAATAAVPTAVLGLRVADSNVLPATGVALGIYVAIAIVCLASGLAMKLWSKRIARVAAS